MKPILDTRWIINNDLLYCLLLVDCSFSFFEGIGEDIIDNFRDHCDSGSDTMQFSSGEFIGLFIIMGICMVLALIFKGTSVVKSKLLNHRNASLSSTQQTSRKVMVEMTNDKVTSGWSISDDERIRRAIEIGVKAALEELNRKES